MLDPKIAMFMKTISLLSTHPSRSNPTAVDIQKAAARNLTNNKKDV